MISSVSKFEKAERFEISGPFTFCLRALRGCFYTNKQHRTFHNFQTSQKGDQV